MQLHSIYVLHPFLTNYAVDDAARAVRLTYQLEPILNAMYLDLLHLYFYGQARMVSLLWMLLLQIGYN